MTHLILDLLANTDYDVQQVIGEKLKDIRYKQRKDAHKKMFFDTLDELDDLHNFYKHNRAFRGTDGGCLYSFPFFLRYLDDYEGEGMTEDYFPKADSRWGDPVYRDDNDHIYYKIRRDIGSFLFE